MQDEGLTAVLLVCIIVTIVDIIAHLTHRYALTVPAAELIEQTLIGIVAT